MERLGTFLKTKEDDARWGRVNIINLQKGWVVASMIWMPCCPAKVWCLGDKVVLYQNRDLNKHSRNRTVTV